MPIDARSPPLPFTAITLRGSPVNGSGKSNFGARVAAAEVRDAQVGTEQVRSVSQKLERFGRARPLRARSRDFSDTWFQLLGFRHKGSR